VNDDAKLLPFAESEAGVTGLELLLPLTLKWASEKKINLLKALQTITSEPAGVLGVVSGDLSVNADADVCIFNPEIYWQVTPKNLHSLGKNSPFTGLELAGKVAYTIIKGQLRFQA
jgi:dihydroorotase